MRFEKIKTDSPVPLPHVIPEEKKQGKIDTIRARRGTHKYNNRSRVKHVKKFNNSPKIYVTDTAKVHIGSYYIDHTDSKKYTITVEPLSHHINCKTTGKIIGYGDLVKMDTTLWTNSICNELGRLS